MLPKLSVNAGYKVLEKHPASTSVNMATEKGVKEMISSC